MNNFPPPTLDQIPKVYQPSSSESSVIVQEDNKESVSLAYIHGVQVSHSWHRSIMSLLIYDLNHSNYLGGKLVGTRFDSDGIAPQEMLPSNVS